jgi:hypothetical protein
MPALSKDGCGIRRDKDANTIRARDNAAKKIKVLTMIVSVTVKIALAYGAQSVAMFPDPGRLCFPQITLILPFPLALQEFGVLDS